MPTDLTLLEQLEQEFKEEIGWKIEALKTNLDNDVKLKMMKKEEREEFQRKLMKDSIGNTEIVEAKRDIM